CVESIIKQEPDVILKLRDALRVQAALATAPGTLRIVDDKTLYFRPPEAYLQPEVLLMALRNLMYNAYQRDLKGEPHPVPAPPTPQPAARKQQPPPPPPPQPPKQPAPAPASHAS